MQITDDQAVESSLAALGSEAVHLLCSGDIPALAARFGYALVLDWEPVAAIQEDLASCLAQLQVAGLAQGIKCAATVTYFEQNDSSIFALVECVAPTIDGSGVLLELVVTQKGTDKHVTLEQLSVAA